MMLSDGDMPLVATAEHGSGGRYQAESYLAGWEMGQIAQLLSEQPGTLSISIRAENVRQADLVAMGYGYVMETLKFSAGLVSVLFRREVM